MTPLVRIAGVTVGLGMLVAIWLQGTKSTNEVDRAAAPATGGGSGPRALDGAGPWSDGESVPELTRAEGRLPVGSEAGEPWLPVLPNILLDGMDRDSVMAFFWGDRLPEVMEFFEASGVGPWPPALGFPDGRRLGDIERFLDAGRVALLTRLAGPLDDEQGTLPGVLIDGELAAWYGSGRTTLHDLLDQEAARRGVLGVGLEPEQRAEWNSWVGARRGEHLELRDALRARAFDLVAADLEGLRSTQPPRSGDLFVSPAAAVAGPASQARTRALPPERRRWRLGLALTTGDYYDHFYSGVYTLQLDDDPAFRALANELVAYESWLKQALTSKLATLPPSAFY